MRILKVLTCITIFLTGILIGLNLYKWQPLYNDKYFGQGKNTHSALDYETYTDNQYGKKYYFVTAYKAYGMNQDGDRKFLLTYQLYYEDEMYEGRDVIVNLPRMYTVTRQNIIQKLLGKREKIVQENGTLNEFNDFLVFDEYTLNLLLNKKLKEK